MNRTPRRLGCIAMLVCAIACSDRQLEDGTDDEVEDDPSATDPGVRPQSRGSMYSACTDTPVCAPLEFCVFPQDEAGFCTAACGPDDDASVCADAPGDDRTPLCMDIGLPDGRTVCALSCEGLSCPRQMRCEEVDAAGGAQLACF